MTRALDRSPLASCLYEGWVRHRRFTPRRHEFRYHVVYLYLDLGELERVFDGRWAWSTQSPAIARWRRADHLGPAELPLDVAVRDLVQHETGSRPRGAVRLLTMPRYWGFGFNPVSFYFCHDEDHDEPRTIVAEVNNTPWRERRCYVLHQSADQDPAGARRWRFAKDFHVSPYLPMDLEYDWSFSAPGEALGTHFNVARDGELQLDATLALRRRAITTQSLASALVRNPFPPAKVLLAIHFEALRLWLKKTPFHEHPKWKTASDPTR